MVGQCHDVDIGAGVGLDDVEVDGGRHGASAGAQSADNQTFFDLWSGRSFRGICVSHFGLFS